MPNTVLRLPLNVCLGPGDMMLSRQQHFQRRILLYGQTFFRSVDLKKASRLSCMAEVVG